MPVFLRVHPLQNVAQAEGGRLLRVLLLRIGSLPAHSRAAQLLSVSASIDVRLFSRRLSVINMIDSVT
jgi:hypothetical protein